MLRNYLTIALRALNRHKGFAAINLVGLAVGLAAGLLILTYVTHELSFDDFHTHGDDIYRVRYDFFRDGERVFKSATAYPRVGPAMQDEFPEVEDYARLFLRYGGGVVRVEDRAIQEQLLFQADPSFLTMFDYPMLRGDRTTALTEPNTAVLSAETARRYFGDEDPIGKRFRFGTDEEYVVTGVATSPENSHIKFNVLLSYVTLTQQWGEYFETAWGWYDFYTYLRLTPGADPAALEAKLPAFIDRQADQENAHQRTIFVLQPLRDIHLHSDLIQEARINGDATSVYFLAVIAFFILVIAWVNYVNLATARAMERAKEIGIRKAVGANQPQLIRQFILETLLLNAFAAGLAVVLYVLALPLFNTLAGKALTFNVAANAGLWAGMAGVFVIGALLAGCYPAFVLSAYRPVTVLKGTFSHTRRGLLLRKTLVVGQFVASVGLIAGTFIIYQQLAFMRDQELGIDIEQTLVIDGPGVIEDDSLYADQLAGFKQEVLKHAAVRSVTASTEIPGNLIYWTNGARKLGTDPGTNTIMYQVGVDYDYLDAYDHTLLAGRGYDPARGADEGSVVLNETAVRVLGFPGVEQTVNQQVLIGGDTLTVVGVVADFHQEGLQKAYDQIAFQLRPAAQSYYSVKVEPDDLPATLRYVGEQYARFFPENPFTYFFLDRHFDAQYASYQRFGKVFGFFAGLAILVACLGLFGLSSFATTQRTKEIGIRKVLGSTVTGLLLLLSKDFLKLVLLGSLIAVPIVWFLMARWLDTFAYRIAISWGIFLSAGLSALLIAILTVSYQTVKAARVNPARSLRYE